MLLTIKTLRQEAMQLEVSPDATCASIKQRLCDNRPAWQPTQLKLVYQGRVLRDDATVETEGVTSKGFLVLMVSKPASLASSLALDTTPLTAPVPPPVLEVPTLSSTSVSGVAPALSDSPGGAVSDGTALASINRDPAASAAAEVTEAKLANLEAMGFARCAAEPALHTACGSIERAVHILTGGGGGSGVSGVAGPSGDGGAALSSQAERLARLIAARRREQRAAKLAAEPAHLQMLGRMPEVMV